MARRIDEPVRVALRPGGQEPAAFTWGRRRYTVEHVEACWKEVGPWWDGEGERTFFRVTHEQLIRTINHDSRCLADVSVCMHNSLWHQHRSRIVLAHIVIQHRRKQRALTAIRPLNKALHPIPRMSPGIIARESTQTERFHTAWVESGCDAVAVG